MVELPFIQIEIFNQHQNRTLKESIYLDDGCNELFQKAMAEQWRPVVMDKVDHQALNVGAILILSQKEYSADTL